MNRFLTPLPIKIRLEVLYIKKMSKVFDSEENKQHQRFLSNEIHGLTNKIIKHRAATIEIPV